MKTINEHYFIHGHRGARGMRTENSLDGFRYAIEHGAQYVELDIVLTQDKFPIVSHEPWMSADTCTQPNGERISEEEERQLNLYEMSLQEAQSFHIGGMSQKKFPLQKGGQTFKPSLAEVVRECNALTTEHPHFIGFNIEIKSRSEWDMLYHPEPAEYAKHILQKLEECDLPNESILQSFDHRILQELHLQQCRFHLVALAETTEEMEFMLRQLSFTPWGVGPHFSMIDAPLVYRCSSSEMNLLAWTVNEESDIMKLLNLGVSHIITDFPEMASKCVRLFSEHRV